MHLGNIFFLLCAFCSRVAIKKFAYKWIMCGTQDGDDNEHVTMGRKRAYTMHFHSFRQLEKLYIDLCDIPSKRRNRIKDFYLKITQMGCRNIHKQKWRHHLDYFSICVTFQYQIIHTLCVLLYNVNNANNETISKDIITYLVSKDEVWFINRIYWTLTNWN
jgi:hypothetical protein